MVKPFRRGFFTPVGLVAGAAVPAAEVSPALLQGRVLALLSSR